MEFCSVVGLFFSPSTLVFRFVCLFVVVFFCCFFVAFGCFIFHVAPRQAGNESMEDENADWNIGRGRLTRLHSVKYTWTSSGGPVTWAPSGSRTASWVINSDICAAETEGRRRGNEEAFSPEQRGKSGKTTPRGGRDGREGGVEEGERRKTTQRCDWTKASVCQLIGCL